MTRLNTLHETCDSRSKKNPIDTQYLTVESILVRKSIKINRKYSIAQYQMTNHSHILIKIVLGHSIPYKSRSHKPENDICLQISERIKCARVTPFSQPNSIKFYRYVLGHDTINVCDLCICFYLCSHNFVLKQQ